MRFLYDTNILLWFLLEPEKIPTGIRRSIEDPLTKRYFSFVSAWEVAVKISIGKLELEGGVDAFWANLVSNGFIPLAPTIGQISKVQDLVFVHKDPFDRFLVATAIEEDMTFATPDKTIEGYIPEGLRALVD